MDIQNINVDFRVPFAEKQTSDGDALQYTCLCMSFAEYIIIIITSHWKTVLAAEARRALINSDSMKLYILQDGF